MEDVKNSMVSPYDTSKTITKLFVPNEKEVQIYNAGNTPFTNSQIIAKAYIWFKKLDYTMNNAKLVIAIYKKKRYGLTSTSTSIKHTRM